MIKLPRGNTVILDAILTDSEGLPFILGAEDKAVFTVKRRDNRQERPIIQKIITAESCGKGGKIGIKIVPEDTIALETGDYLFDLAVCLGGEDFYTTVIADTFRILPALGDKEAVMYG